MPKDESLSVLAWLLSPELRVKRRWSSAGASMTWWEGWPRQALSELGGLLKSDL